MRPASSGRASNTKHLDDGTATVRAAQLAGCDVPTCCTCCSQIYAIYDYQVAFNVRLATENPFVPTFGADIPGGPPGLGVSSPVSSRIQHMEISYQTRRRHA